MLAVFFLHGAIFSSWVPLIPTVQQRLGLSAGTLGLALLGTGIGSLVAMPPIGRLIGRYGSRRVFAATGLGYSAVLLLPVIAPSLPSLFLALVVFGACAGASDVAMNAQGAVVEARYRRPLMSSFHGVWSLGSLGGAATGGTLAAIGLAPFLRALFPAILVAAGMALAARAMLPPGTDARSAGPAFIRPPRQLIWLGVIAFCALMAEGSIGDWSAIYLKHDLGAGPGLAAAGYAVFTLTMTIGRLTGDWVTAHLGPVPITRLGGALLAGGLGTALLVSHMAAALIGFALIGLALANVLPVAYSAAGRTPGLPEGTAIAAVSTTGYLGYLVGPPAIGVTADHLTLRGGLGIAAALGVLIALLAPAVRSANAASAATDIHAAAIPEPA